MQQKFNLFHEESEGFSKLIDLLHDPEVPGHLLRTSFTCLLGWFFQFFLLELIYLL